MLLYELAMELDQRSPDVVEAARALGFGDLTAASDLDRDQVAALRSRFAPAVAPPSIGAPEPVAGPDADGATEGAGRRSRRTGVVAVVALVAVALAAFVVLRPGDEDSDPADAASPELAADVDALDRPADGSAAPPRDLAAYCRGAAQVSAFLQELGTFAQAGSTATFADTKDLVDEHRASVAEGMDLVVASGPPTSDEDAAAVAQGLDEMLAAVAASADEQELAEAYPEARSVAVTDALDRLTADWDDRCA